MITHAKCPECERECIFNGSVAGAGAIMCPYTHWTGPYRTTESEAWLTWDTVVGAYWREKAEHEALEEREQKLMNALEKEQNDGEEER